MAAGAVHFIDISGVCTHFGNKWPSIKDKIHDYIRSDIERRLTEADPYTLYGDKGYIIVFSRLSENGAPSSRATGVDCCAT